MRSGGWGGKFVAICHELMENTRAALLDGTITLILSHPLERMCEELLRGMIRAADDRSDARTHTCILPFDIYTRENI